MIQCTWFDQSFSGDGSLVAWQLACFLLRLNFTKALFSLNLGGIWRKQDNWMHVSHTDRCVQHVEVAWQWRCVYEKESSRVATTSAVKIKKEMHERKKKRSSMSQPDNCSLQVLRVTSGVITTTEKMGSWVSAHCVSPGKLCQDSRIARHQTASGRDKQISSSSSDLLYLSLSLYWRDKPFPYLYVVKTSTPPTLLCLHYFLKTHSIAGEEHFSLALSNGENGRNINPLLNIVILFSQCQRRQRWILA